MQPRGDEQNPDAFLGYTIVRIGHELERRFEEALGTSGLTARQFGVLAHLMHEPGLGSAQLARLVLITPQSMGELLTSLETDGYIVRDRSGGRGQRIKVDITPLGRSVLERTWQVVAIFEAATTMTLSVDEADLVNRLLHRILAGFASGRGP